MTNKWVGETVADQKIDSTREGPDPRIRLAAERTLLAWIRTGLAMMGFGFVVARFGLFLHEIAAVEQKRAERSSGLSLWLGTALVAMGVMVNLLAVIEYRGFLKRITLGETDSISRWSLGISTSIVLAALGVGMIGYLLTL